MRILVGHTNQMPQIRQHQPLPTREDARDEILAFGNGYQQVEHQPGMPWQELLANCPPGWQPDLYIHWSPEYNAVPQGLEQADCLTLGVFGDWNLGGHAIRNIAGIFDVLVADRAGGELLRQAGYNNVLDARLWAYDPDLHRRETGIGSSAPDCGSSQHLPVPTPNTQHPTPNTRDIDVLMIGNFNHAIHAGRSRFIARVARLSTRYNVVLTCGVYGEEYTRIMNRARIVFNHSVGGGINMRAYEAPACGALLFNEAVSNEIRDIYTDGIDCVLYDESNVERLLDYYLAPEHAAERETIAQAGWERVQSHTYARHFAELLCQLEPLTGEFAQDRAGMKAKRAYLNLPPHEQTACLATHWIRTSDPVFFPRVEALLTRADQNCSIQSQVDRANLHAVLLGKWAEVSPSPARECTFADAIAQAQRAVALEPDYVMGYCNLAYICFAVQQIPAGERFLRRALRMLDSPTLSPEQLRGDHFPHGYNYFHMESERIWGRHTPGSPEWHDALRDALRCRINMTLAEIAYGYKDFVRARQHSLTAIKAAPAVAKAHYNLGIACRALGQAEAATEAFRRAIDLSPFLLEAWLNLGQLYLEMNRQAEALALMEDLTAILDGCPIYANVRGEYDRLRDEVRNRAGIGS